MFDTLAMTVSADANAPTVTLGALARIRHELGCNTSLGVSNVSFGLPARDLVNSTFFAIALQSGLSAAIMNPHSAAMMSTYYAYRALRGYDASCADYMAFAQNVATMSTVSVAPTANVSVTDGLQGAIVKGLAKSAATLCEQLLGTAEPLVIIEREIIPALDEVGRGFEQKTVYLPQLLMSAEAAQAAFAVIKSHMGSANTATKGHVILATVKGDIHDIGKNIVRLLMENYGFAVTDLGRDVAPETVLDAVKQTGATIVGLSALMTTTVPAMEETIALLHREAPDCRVIVGGAVLTADYAEKIGAHAYARDAMEGVRIAEHFWSELQ